MIDHAAARRMAAINIDFLIEPDERDALSEHLRGCLDCDGVATGLHRDAAVLRGLDLGPVPDRIRARVEMTSERTNRTSAGRWMAVAAAVVILVSALGVTTLSAGSGGLDVLRTLGDSFRNLPADLVGRQFDWSTAVASLHADDFWIETGGRRFVPPVDAQVQVSSDPTIPTLEIAWKDGAIEQRLSLSFTSDGQVWRVREARIFDGRVPGNWLTTTALHAEAPLGVGFEGDVDVSFTDGASTGRLVMRGVELRANPQPMPGDDDQKLIGPDAPPVPGKVVPAPQPNYRLNCGPVEAGLCRKIADGIVTELAQEFPNKQVLSVSVVDERGGYDVTFDDGTVSRRILD